MSDLIARLEALAPVAAPGDWLDVVARAERKRRRMLRRRLVAAVAVAVFAVPTIAIATRYWDALSLTSTPEEVPLPQGESTLGYVIGDRLHLPGRPPAKLGAPLVAPFVHPETRLVVPSPDRAKVVYHSWDGDLNLRTRPPRGVPVLRLFDAETGRDVVIARNASSPAWRSDGALAYTRLRATEEEIARRRLRIRLGDVMVRPGPRRPAARWSTFASPWRVLAWAGRHLLAQAAVSKPDRRFGVTFTENQLHAFSGPGRSRRLPVGNLIAVSPDGRYVLGHALGHASPQRRQGSDSLLRIVEVATGRILDEIVQTRGPGAWAGDTILLVTGFVSEPIPPGPGGVQVLPGPDHVEVIVLRFSEGKLIVERELRLSRPVIEATGLRASNFYFGFEAPAFVDEEARQFTAKLVIYNTLKNRQLEEGHVYLTCDRIEFRCRRGRSLNPREVRWSSLVTNPSRPLTK
jgi:hypothetical protein